jgi:hypothetical protein
VQRVLIAIAVALLVIAPAAGSAQTSSSLSDSDIQRLRTAVVDARGDVDRARARDQQLAASLSKELDGLADEVTYLAVKLRKEQQVPRSEYMDLRDRIDDLRTRARGDSTPPSTTSSSAAIASEIPVGTELDVRLLDPLSSGRNQVEDRFRATTMVDLRIGDQVLIPAGSEMRGVIMSLEKAGRVDRKGNMTLAFDQITVDGTRYAMHGTVTKAFEGEMKGEVGKLGVGAAAGAIIGGIIGGAKGAAAGVLIGGGGVAAATPGTDAELEQGTILRVRLDQPPPIGSRER